MWKKSAVSLTGILVAVSLSACGNKTETVCKDVTQSITQSDSGEGRLYVNDAEVEREECNSIAEDVQTDTGKETAQTGKDADAEDSGRKKESAHEELDALTGEYDYTAEDGAGKLIIQKTSAGYDISDYESEAAYRFLANSSNIETIEKNRICIKYPEQVFSDDTVLFCYYILEYDTEGIDVYYGKNTPEEARFLYHAVKQGDKGESEDTSDDNFIDYEALGIKEYEYPPEFIMGDDLKTALAQLALGYISFDSDTPRTSGFQEYFIAQFIQNSRLSFAYLDRVSAQNNGQIGIDELNYMQYSLTNTELDFSSVVSGSIDRYEAASLFSHGTIVGYDYESTENGVLVNADMEVRYDGTEEIQKCGITAKLVRNPYSCFDGYSITALTSAIADNMQGGTNLPAEDAAADLYVGVYCSYDVEEPALEIKKNGDGTCHIQIELFRLCGLDGNGNMTEDGLEFTAAGPGDNETGGIIKVEGDIATVTIFGQEWLDFAGLSEYKFYRSN